MAVELVERDGMTELTLRHELLPQGAAASRAGGWGSMLERLADEVGCMTDVAKPAIVGGRRRDLSTHGFGGGERRSSAGFAHIVAG